MPSLMPKVKGDQPYVQALIQRLLDRCLKGEKYAQRWDAVMPDASLRLRQHMFARPDGFCS